jgi:hypothetical protein
MLLALKVILRMASLLSATALNAHFGVAHVIEGQVACRVAHDRPDKQPKT